VLLIVIRCLSDHSSLVLCLCVSALKRDRSHINNVLYLQAREVQVGVKIELLAPAMTMGAVHIAGAPVLQPYSLSSAKYCDIYTLLPAKLNQNVEISTFHFTIPPFYTRGIIVAFVLGQEGAMPPPPEFWRYPRLDPALRVFIYQVNMVDNKQHKRNQTIIAQTKNSKLISNLALNTRTYIALSDV